MAESSPGILTLHVTGQILVDDVVKLLETIDECYSGLWRLAALREVAAAWSQQFAAGPLRLGIGPVPLHDRLVLSAASISSPGIFTFQGSGEPLRELRKFLNDRHRRKQDKEWRDQHERRMAEIELETAKVEQIRRAAEFMKQLGLSELEIQSYVRSQLMPFRELAQLQDANIVSVADDE